VRAQLARQGILITKLRRTSRLVLKSSGVGAKDISHFTRQLAYLLRAGFPLLPALDCLTQQYLPTARIQTILVGLKSSLEDGMTFSVALRQYPNHFSALYCRLIEISEQCGSLADQLLQLADYQEKLLAIRHNIYKALYYPMSLLGFSVIVLILLVLWVVPQFEQLFATVGATLPYSTRVLIYSVHWFQAYGFLIFLSGLGLCGMFMLFRKNLKIWMTPWNAIVLKIPWIGSIVQQAIMARFAYTLSTTLTAGLPILDALAATLEVVHYAIYRTAILKTRQAMMAGFSLDQALGNTHCFPPLLIQMITIGQLGGHLEKNLTQLADFLDTRVSESVSSMISFLEPTLLLVLGIIIGMLMLALYLPIFELGNVVGLP
jgi:type IV pilus assembly protein PilC